MNNREQVFKINVLQVGSTTEKKEVIKLLIILKLLEHNRGNYTNTNIYTNIELENKMFCDIYYENLKTKEVLIFEIVKDIPEDKRELKNKYYKDLKISFMEKVDWNIIDTEDFPDDIKLMGKKILEMIGRNL